MKVRTIFLFNCFFVTIHAFGSTCTIGKQSSCSTQQSPSKRIQSKEDIARWQLLDSLQLVPSVLVSIINQYCFYKGSFIPLFNPGSREYTRVGAAHSFEGRKITVCGFDSTKLLMFSCILRKQCTSCTPGVPLSVHLPEGWGGQFIMRDLNKELQPIEEDLQLSDEFWCGDSLQCHYHWKQQEKDNFFPQMNEAMRLVLAMLMSFDMSAELVDSEAVKLGQKNSMLYMVDGMHYDHLMQGIKDRCEEVQQKFAYREDLQSFDYGSYLETIVNKFPKHKDAIQKIIDGQGRYVPVFWPRSRKLQECVELAREGDDDISLRHKCEKARKRKRREILRQSMPPVRKQKLFQ